MLQVLRHLHGADDGVAGQQDVLDVLLGVGVPGVEAGTQHCPWYWGRAAPGGYGHGETVLRKVAKCKQWSWVDSGYGPIVSMGQH